jgi:hypothetical protein
LTMLITFKSYGDNLNQITTGFIPGVAVPLTPPNELYEACTAF